MTNTLIDAGPVIALFDSSDRYHQQAVDSVRALSNQLVSTWPVITEAAHMLDFDPRAQDGLLEWIERGGIEIHPITRAEVSRIRALIQQYDDLPMDLADASLVVVSELTGIEQVLSVDRDFYVYRRSDGRVIENVFRRY